MEVYYFFPKTHENSPKLAKFNFFLIIYHRIWSKIVYMKEKTAFN